MEAYGNHEQTNQNKPIIHKGFPKITFSKSAEVGEYRYERGGVGEMEKYVTNTVFQTENSFPPQYFKWIASYVTNTENNPHKIFSFLEWVIFFLKQDFSHLKYFIRTTSPDEINNNSQTKTP